MSLRSTLDPDDPALTSGKGEGDGTTPDRPLPRRVVIVSSNRQVSPNQTALWTIYELIDMQVMARPAKQPTERPGRGRPHRVFDLIRRLAERAHHWARLRCWTRLVVASAACPD
jgi:hypothetical protein